MLDPPSSGGFGSSAQYHPVKRLGAKTLGARSYHSRKSSQMMPVETRRGEGSCNSSVFPWRRRLNLECMRGGGTLAPHLTVLGKYQSRLEHRVLPRHGARVCGRARPAGHAGGGGVCADLRCHCQQAPLRHRLRQGGVKTRTFAVASASPTNIYILTVAVFVSAIKLFSACLLAVLALDSIVSCRPCRAKYVLKSPLPTASHKPSLSLPVSYVGHSQRRLPALSVSF